jgi:hypothetical protein
MGGGFFNKPGKAFKGFMRDPIGKVCTDINRGLGIENKNDNKKTIECKEQCVDTHFLKQQNSMDKKFLEKSALDIYNGIQCNKKCESIYNHPIVTGRK